MPAPLDGLSRTRAGQPCMVCPSQLFSRTVYPRACGGARAALGSRWCFAGQSPQSAGRARAALGFRWCFAGLSPRVRGSHSGHQERGAPTIRSIPARAGEPTWYLIFTISRQLAKGSIPARAGEPPRGSYSSATIVANSGLSPRVRGSLLYNEEHHQGTRWVYPRACGGAALRTARMSVDYALGLSPRVRGSLEISHLGCRRISVYPRTRGAADTPSSVSHAD